MSATLGAALALALTAPAAIGGEERAATREPTVPSPWHDARPGTTITYRLSEPRGRAGSRIPRVAIVTEEVVGADAKSVVVRVTRREDGVADRVVTNTYPRALPAGRQAQFVASLGPRRATTTLSVSGRKLACSVHRNEPPGDDRGARIVVATTVCRGVPGWIHTQSVGRAGDATLAPRFELLEFRR